MSVSFEQLQAFVTSARSGSFSEAGRRLGKAQSVISTAVINLEIDLGLTLFDRSGKYPRLTPAGEALLDDAEQLLIKSEFFTPRANGLAEGVEHRVTLAIDDLVLVEDLNPLLRRLGEKFPHVKLDILRASLGDVGEMVAAGRADIGIMAPIDLPGEGFNYRLVTNVTFVAVVAASHALATFDVVSAADLEPHRQIAETSRSGDREPPYYIMSRYVWYAESLHVACDLIRQGFGWGIMPEKLIGADIRQGCLKKLSLKTTAVDFLAPIYLVWSKRRRLGKAGQWLHQALTDPGFWHQSYPPANL